MASKHNKLRSSSSSSSFLSPCVAPISRRKTPPTEENATKNELEELKKQIQSIQKQHRQEIDELKKQVSNLQLEMSKSEDRSMVQERVNDALRREVDRLEQYGRRNCLVFKGVPPAHNESVGGLTTKVRKVLSDDLKLSDKQLADLDKTHRIGPVLTDAKGKKFQNTIVRFKSHSVRYAAYLKRGTVRKKGLKITPSLTNRRRKLLDYANENYSENPAVDFVFCDIHGDLKVKLKEKVRGKNFHLFNSLDDIQWLLHEVSQEDHETSSPEVESGNETSN